MVWEADENGDGFVEWDELLILYKRVRNDKDWIEAQVADCHTSRQAAAGPATSFPPHSLPLSALAALTRHRAGTYNNRPDGSIDSVTSVIDWCTAPLTLIDSAHGALVCMRIMRRSCGLSAHVRTWSRPPVLRQRDQRLIALTVKSETLRVCFLSSSLSYWTSALRGRHDHDPEH